MFSCAKTNGCAQREMTMCKKRLIFWSASGGAEAGLACPSAGAGEVRTGAGRRRLMSGAAPGPMVSRRMLELTTRQALAFASYSMRV